MSNFAILKDGQWYRACLCTEGGTPVCESVEVQVKLIGDQIGFRLRIDDGTDADLRIETIGEKADE